MSKKTTVKIICILIATFLFLLVAIPCTYAYSGFGLDYTKDYKVYNEVKNLTTLEDVRQKLQSLNVEYIITEQTLTAKGIVGISFSVNEDKTCIISNDSIMTNLQKLDEEDLSVVKVHGISVENKIVEKTTIKDGARTYTKFNNLYYIKNNIFLLIAMFAYLFAALFAIWLILEIIDSKKKAKIP